MWRVIIKVSRFLIVVASAWCISGPVFAQEATVSGTRETTDSLSAKGLYDEGVRQRLAGQLAVAEKTFEQVLRLQPDNAEAYFQLARLYIDNDELTAAGRAAMRAAELKPDNEQYWTTVLDVYRRTRNIKAMSVVLDELIRLDPENVSFYYEKAYALFLDKQYRSEEHTSELQ